MVGEKITLQNGSVEWSVMVGEKEITSFAKTVVYDMQCRVVVMQRRECRAVVN